MKQKTLPERLSAGFPHLNTKNRGYIEHLTANLAEIDSKSPAKLLANASYTESPSHKSEKTTIITHHGAPKVVGNEQL